MAPISGFIILCLLITFGYFVGLLTFLTDHEENKCDMTFMFEYPQFVRINSEDDSFYKKYGLYAYSEGRLTEYARRMQFRGIPVLFVPGNAGSYKQVRSFASVALRKSLNSRPGFHFDFFTLDLNNELSGLNGALLNEQMHYVNQSISRILELYDDDCRYSPKSLVIIAHSMGGIIVRGLLATLPRNSTLIPLVITLATPHARPPVATDLYMADYYTKMQRNSTLPDNTTIIALSGGYNDFLIPPFITYGKDFENLQVVTTSVPLLWLPVDHLCILWCKQLVLAVTRGLFDLANITTKQISLNSEYHRQVFQHYLVQHSGTKVHKADQYKLPVQFARDGYLWSENLQTQYTVSLLNGTKQTQWHMIRLLDQPSHEFLTILALNLEASAWVYACPAVHSQGQSRICLTGKHLSHMSEIAPSIKYKRRTLRIDLHKLKKDYAEATHVVVRVPQTKEPVVLHMDIYNSEERKIEVALPRWWTLTRQYIISETPEKVLNYELVLPQLLHIIQSYKLYIEPVKCSHNIHHAVASLTVPWANQGIHKYFTETERNPLDVRLYFSRPNGINNNSHAVIRLTLDPICTYSVSIRNSIVGMLGQLARTYSTLLIANMTAVILLAFRRQLVSIDATGSCSIFFNAMRFGVKPYYILTMVKLASRGLSWKGFSRVLPLPDWHLIADEGNDFFLLPLLLYMCSVGIVWLSALGIAASLIFCESTFHKVTSKFLARTITGAMRFSDWLIGGFHKLPCVVATVLVLLSISTCGALALCLGCGFYFLKLTQMSQDYVEGLVIKVVKYLAKKLKRRVAPQRENQNNSSTRTDSSRNEQTEDSLADRGLERTEDEILPQQDELQDDNLDNEAETKTSQYDELQDDNLDNEAETKTSQDDEDGEEKTKLDIKPNIEKQNKDSQKNTDAIPGCSSQPDVTETNENEQLLEPNREISENNLEEIEKKDSGDNSGNKPAEYSAIFFHFTIFLLWCIVTGLNVPSVLTWAHNFKFNTALQPDPSFLPGIVLSLCAIPLWQLDLPKTNLSMYTQVGQVFNLLAAISLIYAPLSVYRLVFIVTAAIMLITLHQLLAPARIEVVEETPEAERLDRPDPETMLNKIKAKWE